jgi:hypothetical protein
MWVSCSAASEFVKELMTERQIHLPAELVLPERSVRAFLMLAALQM